jgi:hypothetical protein
MQCGLGSFGSATKAYLSETSGHAEATDLAVVVDKALVSKGENGL